MHNGFDNLGADASEFIFVFDALQLNSASQKQTVSVPVRLRIQTGSQCYSNTEKQKIVSLILIKSRDY